MLAAKTSAKSAMHTFAASSQPALLMRRTRRAVLPKLCQCKVHAELYLRNLGNSKTEEKVTPATESEGGEVVSIYGVGSSREHFLRHLGCEKRDGWFFPIELGQEPNSAHLGRADVDGHWCSD